MQNIGPQKGKFIASLKEPLELFLKRSSSLARSHLIEIAVEDLTQQC